MTKANIVVTEYKNRICALCFQNNRLEALHVDTQESLLNSIYIAKVKNISKNINAAFVELFDGQMAFLPLDDAMGCSFISSTDGRLREGDEIPVQVIREAVKTKDPVVTTKLSISGAYAVVSLDKRKGGFQFSKKLSIAKKEAIKEALCDFKLPTDYAVVVRTGVEQLDEYESLKTELSSLVSMMDDLVLKAKTRTCFSQIYQGIPSYIEYLHHISNSDYEEVVTDVPTVHEALQVSYKGNMPIRLYNDTFPLSKLYSIDSKMEELFSKRVNLKSGANLIIEYTEAMTVIDVNTAKCINKKDKDTLNYKINLEAAEEIARQLRLRNLSGIIIVDFINMENTQYQVDLITELKRLLKSDPVTCNYVDITALGLVEITRKKVQKPILEVFSKIK